MKALESLWYEVSPYVFFIIGISAISNAGRMGEVFGVLLLLMALLIIKMRWTHRATMAYGRARAARRAPRRVAASADTRARYRPSPRIPRTR